MPELLANLSKGLICFSAGGVETMLCQEHVVHGNSSDAVAPHNPPVLAVAATTKYTLPAPGTEWHVNEVVHGSLCGRRLCRRCQDLWCLSFLRFECWPSIFRILNVRVSVANSLCRGMAIVTNFTCNLTWPWTPGSVNAVNGFISWSYGACFRPLRNQPCLLKSGLLSLGSFGSTNASMVKMPLSRLKSIVWPVAL